MKSFIFLLAGGGILFLMASCNKSKKGSYIDRVAEEHQDDSPVSNGSKTYEQQQPVDTMTVDYAETGIGTISGYYAQPKDANGKLPGIIVIHEWWGLNDNIRMMTRRLAGLGMKALAVDLYNGKTGQTSDEAMQLMCSAMKRKPSIISNLKQAFRYLKEEKSTGKIGVIGWCFGGGWSLQTALALPDKIHATVIYYGELVTDKSKLKPLGMPVLAFFGGKDNSIPQSTINTFKNTLEDLGKTVDVHVSPDANHAFANPSGTMYNEKAANDAWKKTKVFLAKYLKA